MKHLAQWLASFLANPLGRYLQGTSAEKRKGMTKWGKKLIYLCSLDSVCQENQWSLALRDQTKMYPKIEKSRGCGIATDALFWRDLGNGGKGSHETQVSGVEGLAEERQRYGSHLWHTSGIPMCTALLLTWTRAPPMYGKQKYLSWDLSL